MDILKPLSNNDMYIRIESALKYSNDTAFRAYLRIDVNVFKINFCRIYENASIGANTSVNI